jgi:hypothetical protein
MEADGFSENRGAVVLEIHFFSMFAPGFITGNQYMYSLR